MFEFLGAYLHRMDPFAIGFIRWYGLAYLTGFVGGFLWIRSLARRNCSPMPPEAVADFICLVALGTVLGGRLGYCVFYKPELLVQFSGDFPFWDALAINQGGMASHGGIIGMVLAIFWFARKVSVPGLHLMDLVALTAPIGVFLGRLANFVNGELYGRICSPELPWAVKFPQELLEWRQPGHPSHALLGSADFKKVVDLVADGASSAPVEAVVLAVQTNDAVAAALEPLLPTRHPSQLYAGLLEGLVVIGTVAWFWRKPRKPGVVSGVCLLTYAVVRILGEQFRMPDAHLGFRALGLTRGQWISVFLFLVAAAFFVWTSRREAPLMGGIFGRRSPPDGGATTSQGVTEPAAVNPKGK